MSTDSDGPATVRSGRRRVIIVASAVAAALLLLGGGSAIALVVIGGSAAGTGIASGPSGEGDAAEISTVEFARDAASDLAADARAVLALVADVDSPAVTDSSSELETATDGLDAALTSEADDAAEADAAPLTLESANVQAALKGVAEACDDLATDRLAADPLAEATTRAAVTDAQDELTVAVTKHVALAKPLSALLAAMAAADASQAAASGVPSAGTGSGSGAGGNPGGSSGSGSAGGGATPPVVVPADPPPPPPPPAPPYTDADARAAVSNAYGGQVGTSTGICAAINWGTFSIGNTPPPPRVDLIPIGAWMAFKAWSIGNGGEVHYYACH